MPRAINGTEMRRYKSRLIDSEHGYPVIISGYEHPDHGDPFAVTGVSEATRETTATITLLATGSDRSAYISLDRESIHELIVELQRAADWLTDISLSPQTIDYPQPWGMPMAMSMGSAGGKEASSED